MLPRIIGAWCPTVISMAIILVPCAEIKSFNSFEDLAQLMESMDSHLQVSCSYLT